MAKGKRKNAWINSPQADAVAAYYVDGHSVADTAEHFGVSRCQVNNLAKARRLTNGRQWREGSQESNNQRSKEAEQRIVQRVESLGFAYVGGYSDKKGYVTIKCKTCGAEYKRTVDHIRRGKNKVICIECQKKQTQERQAKTKAVARQNAEVRELERKWLRILYPPKDYGEELHQRFLNRTGVCEICGKEYSVRDYTTSAKLKYAVDNGVCSAECKKEKQRRLKRKHRTPSNHRHRAHIFGVAYESGITLKKLVARDGLTCAICGKKCDWGDHSWSEYSGPMYPSIDHIVPMSKGGGHTWSNVQVAHLICNSYKSDSTEEGFEYDAG